MYVWQLWRREAWPVRSYPKPQAATDTRDPHGHEIRPSSNFCCICCILCTNHLLLVPKDKLARAAIPSLCTPPLFSHTPLLPSTIEISSSATLCANIVLPLPFDRLLLAASSIHMTAVRRLWRRFKGMGICKATPPPAAPLCDRIRSRGATESIARVR